MSLFRSSMMLTATNYNPWICWRGHSNRIHAKISTYFPIKQYQNNHVTTSSRLHRTKSQYRCASRLAYYEFGEPSSVIKYENYEDPVVEESETNIVLIKMLAAPINPAHINTIQGTYGMVPKQFPAVGGTEGIGQVIQVGKDVKRLKRGDLVFPSMWYGDGFWTTHIKESETKFDPVSPETQLKYESASTTKMQTDIIIGLSTLRINPGTALRILKDVIPDLEKGDVVLQNGANSAVGQAVIQIAKEMQLFTVNIVRDREDIGELKEYLYGIGADVVWTEKELRTAKEFRDNIFPKARLALNCVGGESSTEISKCLERGGCHVTYGGMGLKPVTASTSSLIFRDLTYKGFWFGKWVVKHAGTPALQNTYNELEAMLMTGKITAPKYRLVPFNNEADCRFALERTPKGNTGGKFIFDMRQELN